jgi:hypothetical protein
MPQPQPTFHQRSTAGYNTLHCMQAEDAKAQGYTFPYLFDSTQEVAKAYSAACTPEFYVFDADRKLFYHGQFDNSRPSKYGGDTPVTGALRCATKMSVMYIPGQLVWLCRFMLCMLCPAVLHCLHVISAALPASCAATTARSCLAWLHSCNEDYVAVINWINCRRGPAPCPGLCVGGQAVGASRQEQHRLQHQVRRVWMLVGSVREQSRRCCLQGSAVVAPSLRLCV